MSLRTAITRAWATLLAWLNPDRYLCRWSNETGEED